MADRPRAVVIIQQFPGLVDSVDEFDTSPGAAQIQTNLQSQDLGILEVRPGYLEVEFET
jgi:hypothetical protein